MFCLSFGVVWHQKKWSRVSNVSSPITHLLNHLHIRCIIISPQYYIFFSSNFHLFMLLQFYTHTYVILLLPFSVYFTEIDKKTKMMMMVMKKKSWRPFMFTLYLRASIFACIFHKKRETLYEMRKVSFWSHKQKEIHSGALKY